jgi:hypothetical protein
MPSFLMGSGSVAMLCLILRRSACSNAVTRPILLGSAGGGDVAGYSPLEEDLSFDSGLVGDSAVVVVEVSA